MQTTTQFLASLYARGFTLRADCTRLFVWNNPEFEGFFDLKQMNPNRAAKMNTMKEVRFRCDF